MELSGYRLTDWEWISVYKKKYGEDSYQAYKNKIFDMLDKLEKGRCYDLSTVESRSSTVFIVHYTQDGVVKQDSNPDFFIKLCCTYMLSADDYLFSDDYQKIKRLS